MTTPFSRLVAQLAALAFASVLAACASGDMGPTVATLPPPSSAVVTAPKPDYVIAPLDRVSVSVFQVPDLSQKELQVDAGGGLNLPLIGAIQAAGKTADQLSQEIETRLSQNYLQNPQVSVTVDEATSQNVTVEGAVMQPGVFPITGNTTLLQAIALARGPDRTADISQVAIFRTVEGRRAAAVFDLSQIRRGAAPDPQIYGNDIVVVQTSGAKSAWQEVLRTIPAIGIFNVF